MLVTNDPWQTAGQINDLTVLTPVFKGHRIVGYFASTCHAPDIGGRILSAEAHEVYEEGLRVPITKLFDRGEPNHELIKIIRANVRTPEETVGDLYAQASCNAVGARSLLQVMDEFGRETIDPGLTRRNIVVAGINLLALKGKVFHIGEAVLEYSGECHPCSRMEKNLGQGGYNAMRGHGGITAKVLKSGSISVNDLVWIP